MTGPATPPELPYEQVAYPPAPWPMVGSMWLSVFRLQQGVDSVRPAGIYGAAFVDYTEGSPLTYGELLVARLMRQDEGRWWHCPKQNSPPAQCCHLRSQWFLFEWP